MRNVFMTFRFALYSYIIEVWEELWNGWKTAKNSREQKKIEFRS